MIVNYGPASRIADDEILVRLKEVEDKGLTITEKLSGIEIDIGNVETKVSEAVETAAGTDKKVTTLTQNVDNITAKVEKIEGSTTDYTEIKATLDGLTITTENGKTIIDGGNIDASNLTLTDKITFSQIGGAVSKEQLDEATKKELKDHGDALDTVLENQGQFSEDLGDVKETVETQGENLTEARDIMAAWISGSATTIIDGISVKTPTIYTTAIHLGGELTVYNKNAGEEGLAQVGYLGYTESNLQAAVEKNLYGIHMAAGTSSNDGGEVAVTTAGAAIRFKNASNQISVGNNTTTFSAGGTNYYLQPGGFRPGEDDDGEINFGSSVARWNTVYALNGVSTTSDANEKNSIETLPDKYIDMFDNLEVKRYKMNKGTSDRYHVGFVSQEVEVAMTDAGIDSQEFGGFIKDKDAEGNDRYMLRYDEFIGILFAKIKQLESRIEELEAK